MSEPLSERHESYLANVLYSERVAGSGSKRESHDVFRVGDQDDWWKFRIEAKATQQKSHSLKQAAWRRLEEDCLVRDARERPVWAARWYGGGPPELAPVLDDVVVLNLHDFVELVDELDRLRDIIKTLKVS